MKTLERLQKPVDCKRKRWESGGGTRTIYLTDGERTRLPVWTFGCGTDLRKREGLSRPPLKTRQNLSPTRK